MSTQGHVTTTDNDGVPLLLLFLLDKQEDVDELQEDLDDQVHVLRTFATAWNRGVKDVNGKDPLPDYKPCNVLVVIKQQHQSSRSPDERKHITVRLASSASWTSQPPTAKGVVHVYSVDDIAVNGFESYRIHATSTSKFGSATMKQAIQNAVSKEYVQKSSNSSKSQGASNT